MPKPPQVRIKVEDVDRLLLLTEAQLKVWLYYKRREGVNGKAWGKTRTIADACGFKNTTSDQVIRNTRAWLVKNGWLKPNGRSNSGLPMFLSIIPRLHLENPDHNPQITPTIIHGLHPLSSPDYTEVPTLKVPNFKDSVVTNGKEGRKEDSFSPPAQIENPTPFESEEKDGPKPTQSIAQSLIEPVWVKGGGSPFRNGDAESAERMLMTGTYGTDDLLAYIRDTFACPKTARIAWDNFSYWAKPENFDLTKRNIDAWRRTKKIKATDPASRPANPNCHRCKGPTYSSPVYEADLYDKTGAGEKHPFCHDCMKLPPYRRWSGRQQSLTANL